MSPLYDQALIRAGATCRKQVSAARISCTLSAEHVRAATDAIDRSLALLNATSCPTAEESLWGAGASADIESMTG